MRIGIDVGGTKIEAILLEETGREAARLRVATPRGDYDGTIAAIADLVAKLEAEAGRTCSVGLGTPGAIDRRTGLMKNANSTWLNERPFDQDVGAALKRDIRMANDANCFALSEAVDGAGAGHRVVFGVIVGTGCGGGIVVDGALLTGPNNLAGEWGHHPLPWPDDAERIAAPQCYCGKTGCIETYLSGPGFMADFHRVTGRRMSPKEIVSEAKGTADGARAAVERYVRRMARALSGIVAVLDPDVIVLGGGMSNLEMIYDRVPDLIPAYVPGGEARVSLKRAVHGDSSGVRGAAWLWPHAKDTHADGPAADFHDRPTAAG